MLGTSVSVDPSFYKNLIIFLKKIFIVISPIQFFFFPTVQHGDPVTHTDENLITLMTVGIMTGIIQAG